MWSSEALIDIFQNTFSNVSEHCARWLRITLSWLTEAFEQNRAIVNVSNTCAWGQINMSEKPCLYYTPGSINLYTQGDILHFCCQVSNSQGLCGVLAACSDWINEAWCQNITTCDKTPPMRPFNQVRHTLPKYNKKIFAIALWVTSASHLVTCFIENLGFNAFNCISPWLPCGGSSALYLYEIPISPPISGGKKACFPKWPRKWYHSSSYKTDAFALKMLACWIDIRFSQLISFTTNFIKCQILSELQEG